MRFYTTQHKFYCGIDLHARTMYLCILDQESKILLHRDIKTDPDIFLKTIAPYRQDIVVAVECIFTWYWLADLCGKENIPISVSAPSTALEESSALLSSTRSTISTVSPAFRISSHTADW